MVAWLIPILAAMAGAGTAYGLNKLDRSDAPGSGTPEQFRQIRTGTPQAEKFQKKLFRSGGGLPKDKLYREGKDFLKDLYSNKPGAFEDFEAPYMQNFQENIMPDIANRFAGMGTGNSGLSSSGFQQTLAQAGRGLQKDLAQMRGGLQMQGLGPALQYAQQPISNQMNAMNWSPYQTTQTPRQPGIYDSMAKLAPGVMQNIFNSPDFQNMFSSNNQMQQGGLSSGGNNFY
jgi:hypothetical protein